MFVLLQNSVWLKLYLFKRTICCVFVIHGTVSNLQGILTRTGLFWQWTHECAQYNFLLSVKGIIHVMCFFLLFFPILKADKEFVWSLWKHLQVSKPGLTQAVNMVVERWVWRFNMLLKPKSNQLSLLTPHSLSF